MKTDPVLGHKASLSHFSTLVSHRLSSAPPNLRIEKEDILRKSEQGGRRACLRGRWWRGPSPYTKSSVRKGLEGLGHAEGQTFIPSASCLSCFSVDACTGL